MVKFTEKVSRNTNTYSSKSDKILSDIKLNVINITLKATVTPIHPRHAVGDNPRILYMVRAGFLNTLVALQSGALGGHSCDRHRL